MLLDFLRILHAVTAGVLYSLFPYNIYVFNQFQVTVVANNSILSAYLVCTVTVNHVPQPPQFTMTAFEVNQDSAFPGSSIGTIKVSDHDGVSASLCDKRLCCSERLTLCGACLLSQL